MTYPLVAPSIPFLKEKIQGWLEEMGLAGLSLALIEDASLIWAEGFGQRDKAAGLPVTPETIFEAASISKPVFANLAFQLVQSGRLDLDAPLSRYLPELYLPDEPHLEAITARRVLCHTTGLPNWRSDATTLRAYFPPGMRYSYSGEGYVYLQRVVEQISGMTLAELSQVNLLRPLGMVHSSFIWEERFDGQATAHYDRQGEPVEKYKPDQANAAYSLNTTPSDLGRFMACLLGKPGASLLTEKMVEEMLTPQIAANDLPPWKDSWPDGPFTPDPNVFWGLGWGIQRWKREDAFFHWGDNGNAHAFAIGFRRSRSGMVAMVNSANGWKLWPRLFGSVFEEHMPAITWLESMYHAYLPAA
jgi:CubicO group peptidase (beta-lactamase class C family)